MVQKKNVEYEFRKFVDEIRKAIKWQNTSKYAAEFEGTPSPSQTGTKNPILSECEFQFPQSLLHTNPCPPPIKTLSTNVIKIPKIYHMKFIASWYTLKSKNQFIMV